MNPLESANLLTQGGELEKAAALCAEMLRNHSSVDASLQMLLAISEKWVARGRYDQAAGCFELMLPYCTDPAPVYFNLAAALIRSGNHRRAIFALREAVRLRPDWLDAHYYLAITSEEIGDLPAAAEQWRRVLALKPDHGSALFRLGATLTKLGDVGGARDCYDRARRAPATALLCNDLGLISLGDGRLDEAIEDFQRATVLDPNFAPGWMNLGIALMRAGKARESTAACQTSIAIEPGRAEAHWNYSLALLAIGEYSKGLAEYEWRLKCPEFSEKVRKIDRPAWRGEDLSGRTILIHDEQGFGDTIQFIRYLPLLARRGAAVIVLCQKPLARLLAGMGSRVICDGDPCPHVDFHAPIASLPFLFETRLETIPQAAAYLRANPALVDSWSKKLPQREGTRRIGLAWVGNRKPNPDRSIPLKFLQPLLSMEGLTFLSLQKQMNDFPPPSEHAAIFDVSTQIADFADTVALIANCDLVISIDTSVAHLAGALGKPTWILLPYAADWRWLLERDDSPWYPTAHLFRQSFPGDWSGVIQRVVEALKRG
jgi:tetratricopeptide (TPR) repeat protein